LLSAGNVEPVQIDDAEVILERLWRFEGEADLASLFDALRIDAR
jgi:hypothetical protein